MKVLKTADHHDWVVPESFVPHSLILANLAPNTRAPFTKEILDMLVVFQYVMPIEKIVACINAADWLGLPSTGISAVEAYRTAAESYTLEVLRQCHPEVWPCTCEVLPVMHFECENIQHQCQLLSQLYPGVFIVVSLESIAAHTRFGTARLLRFLPTWSHSLIKTNPINLFVENQDCDLSPEDMDIVEVCQDVRNLLENDLMASSSVGFSHKIHLDKAPGDLGLFQFSA